MKQSQKTAKALDQLADRDSEFDGPAKDVKKNNELETRDPVSPEVYMHYCVEAMSVGKYRLAIKAMHLAVVGNPFSSKYYNNLGASYLKEGRTSQAMSAFNKSIEIEPSDIVPYHNLFQLYRSIPDYKKALEIGKKIILLVPNDTKYQVDLGEILLSMGQEDKALAVVMHASKLNPQSEIACLGLGSVYSHTGNLDKAIGEYLKAIKVNPKCKEAWNNLGVCHSTRDEHSKATDCFKKALEVDGLFKESRVNLASTLLTQQKYMSAYTEYIELVRHSTIENESAKVVEGLYRSLMGMRKYEEALSFADTQKDNRIRLLTRLHILPPLYDSSQEICEVRERWEHDALSLYRLLDGLKNDDPAWPSLYAYIWQINNFYLGYQMKDDRKLQELYAGILDRILRPAYDKYMQPITREYIHGNKPLKIGVISPNLSNHNGSIWCLGWLDGIAKNPIYEIFTYNIGQKHDEGTKRFAALGTYRHIQLNADNLEYLLQVIRNDELDILIFTDVGMNASSRILSVFRLAAVQILGWGHPITSGSKVIDYFFSGAAMEPPGNEIHYTEQLYRLPGIGLNYELPSLPQSCSNIYNELDLPRDRPILGSLQYICKYHPDYDFIFASIANRHPESLIVLVGDAGISSLGDQLYSRLRKVFIKAGLEISNHLRILPKLKHSDYLGLMGICHHCLDTIGWNGGNTSMQCFALGRPLVTLPTQYMRGRHSVGMLKTMEIDELIASTPAEYLDISSRLIEDRCFYDNILKKIRERSHRLFCDTEVSQNPKKAVDELVKP